MSWLKIDDGFAEHPKIIDLSDRAFRLHVAALCYSARNLTDGVLNARSVLVCCALASATKRHIAELRDVELWVEFNDGYLIKDFLDYNPSAHEVKELRKSRSEAGRIGGKRSGEARRQASASAFASKQKGKPAGSTPSRPVKEPSDALTLQGTSEEHRVGDSIERSLRTVA